MSFLINADDFGMSQEVNEAIIACFRRDFIQRTTLLVNFDYTKDAVSLAKKNDFVSKVGLHINLVEGRPLTEEIRRTPLCHNDGTFNENYFKKTINRFILPRKVRKAIKMECIAQMEKYISYGFSLMHLDSHQHVHANISVLPIVIRAAKQYGFKTIRLARNCPTKNQTGIKGIYKFAINRKILKYNKLHSDDRIRLFGSYNDYEIIAGEEKNKGKLMVTELMCHPVVNNNHVEEHYSHKMIF